MILQQPHNTPLAAPQFEGVSDFLGAYRNFIGLEFLTMEDLYIFLTTPGEKRNEFLKTWNPEIAIIKDNYATQTYLF